MLRTLIVLALAGGFVTSAFAGPVVDLSAESSRQAPNDELQASAYVENSGEHVRDVAKKTNAAIGEALSVAKSYPSIKVQSSGTQTYPLYGKNGKLEGWRMRSSISLQSKDHAAFSEAIGRLQKSLAISELNAAPSADTYRAVESETMVDAISAFRVRAKIVADALGKGYVIKELNVGAQRPPMPVHAMNRSVVMMADAAAPAPVEAGEATVSVTVSGKIEISD